MDIIPSLRYLRNCTGSSREQAATSLKYRGLSLVVAGSYSETYKRNALNNGLLTIEAPKWFWWAAWKNQVKKNLERR